MQKQIHYVVVLFMLAAFGLPALAQSPPSPYPTRAPIERYLIPNQSAEIALARSAAPASISSAAEVLVLGKTGYKIAVPGTNHYVCLVERSWDAAIGDPNFWNPSIRGPDCFNSLAARTYLPIVLKKAEMALAGKSQPQIEEAMRAAFQRGTLPSQQAGAVGYMLSKSQYVDDHARNWHPHLMLIVPLGTDRAWGANLKGSPILATDDRADRLTIIMIPVAHWSDGTPDAPR